MAVRRRPSFASSLAVFLVAFLSVSSCASPPSTASGIAVSPDDTQAVGPVEVAPLSGQVYYVRPDGCGSAVTGLPSRS